MSCLYILEINPSLVSSFANIFSLLVGCLHFVYGFLCCAKAYKFDKVLFVYFPFSFKRGKSQINLDSIMLGTQVK